MAESQIFYRSEKTGEYNQDDEVYIGNMLKRREPVRSLPELAEHYTNSDMNRLAKEEIEREGFVPPEFVTPQYTDKFASSFATQLRENLKREVTSVLFRRRTEFIFQVVRTLLLGIFLGTVFITLETDQTGIRNRVSHIFFSLTFAGFIGFVMIPAVSEERGVFYHEQSSGTYKPSAYGISLLISTFPLIVATTLSYVFPAYWIPDMDPRHEFGRFAFFVLVYFLATLVIVTMSMLLAIAMPTEGIAVMFLGIIVPIFTLFAGFLITRQNIPGWWIWGYWISVLHYGVESIVVSVFSGLEFHCDSSQLVSIGTGQYCPFTTGEQIIEVNGYYSNWKWIDVGVLAGIYAIFGLLICVSLAKIRHAKT